MSCKKFNLSFVFTAQLFFSLPNLCPPGQGEEVVRQRADRNGKGEGMGLKSDRNVPTFFL